MEKTYHPIAKKAKGKEMAMMYHFLKENNLDGEPLSEGEVSEEETTDLPHPPPLPDKITSKLKLNIF
ncbi:22K [Bovine atadenovirus D]|uniref:22K n=1 Tax=Bovine adenovirus 4 TaxID=70333 RepID=Q77YA0_ADEB4|nr:22K [Bovine atadenovirus D]AAQ63163.1 22K [Bovine adenovirus 4]